MRGACVALAPRGGGFDRGPMGTRRGLAERIPLASGSTESREGVPSDPR
jgi:hypothetical protein